MAAEKRSFTDPLEPLIYWDASFAIAFIVFSEAYHDECIAFEARMRAEGSDPVASDFVYNELAFVIIRNALLEEARRTRQHWMEVKSARPDLVLTAIPQVDAAKGELDRLTVYLPTTESVKERAFDLMRQYPLLPTNAYHLACSLEAGVNAFASLDEDLLLVDGIIVYTCVP